MRQIYAERLPVLLECAHQSLTGLLEISGVEAGLQTAGCLHSGLDGELATPAAAKREVEVTPLSRYSHDRMAREGLQLGFAAMDPKEIQRGVRELAIALESELPAFHRIGSRAPLAPCGDREKGTWVIEIQCPGMPPTSFHRFSIRQS
jgi:DNA-binding transcriptional MocR family regulator